MMKSAEELYRWVLDQYPMGQILDFLVILKEIGKTDGSAEGFLSFAEEHFRGLRMKALEAMKATQIVAHDHRLMCPRCPECGMPMNLIHVNTSPRNQIGGRWRSMWQCADLVGCGHDELSEKTYDEEVREKFGGSDPLLSVFRAASPERREEDDLRRKMRRAAARLGPMMGPPRRRRCGG